MTSLDAVLECIAVNFRAPTVLRVPSEYPTIEAAQDYLDAFLLREPTVIEVEAGTYTLTAPIRGHRDGHLLTIKGEEAGTVSDYHDLWPVEDMKASVLEEWGVVFEATKWNAVELNGQKINIDGCAFINIGEAFRGLTTGAWGGRHGNGGFAVLSDVAFVDFDTGVMTEYAGSIRSTPSRGLLLANNGKGVQVQYGGTAFLDGAVIVNSGTYGIRMKNGGLAYARNALITGSGSDGVSLIGASSVNIGLSTIRDNGGWGISLSDVSNALAINATIENNVKGDVLEPSGEYFRR